MLNNLFEMHPERIKKLEKTMQMYDLVYGSAEPARQNFFLKAIEVMLDSDDKNEVSEELQPSLAITESTPTTINKNVDVTNVRSSIPTKIYGENWIVLQNRLLNAISHLDLNERRLMMFLSPVVRKALDINPKERVFYVRVQDFVREYGIKSKNYYSELEKIADTILEKAFFFWYKKENYKTKKGVSWVSECDYFKNEGLLKIKLDDTVIEMLTVFDKANPFTKYERQMIVNLGSYGIILFELIASCMHQQHKQKAYTIEYLREKFNCADIYPIISEFKRNVLDRAIKDVEKNTPYRISYEQKKKGRIISEIVFSFDDERTKKSLKNKSINKAQKVLTNFDNLSESQIKAYSSILSRTHEISDLAENKDYLAFSLWIANILRDPQSVREETAKRVFSALHTNTDFKSGIL